MNKLFIILPLCLLSTTSVLSQDLVLDDFTQSTDNLHICLNQACPAYNSDAFPGSHAIIRLPSLKTMRIWLGDAIGGATNSRHVISQITTADGLKSQSCGDVSAYFIEMNYGRRVVTGMVSNDRFNADLSGYSGGIRVEMTRAPSQEIGLQVNVFTDGSNGPPYSEDVEIAAGATSIDIPWGDIVIDATNHLGTATNRQHINIIRFLFTVSVPHPEGYTALKQITFLEN